MRRILCLGDVVGYGARPNECVDLVRSVAAVCLAGNHHLGVLGKVDVGRFGADAGRAAFRADAGGSSGVSGVNTAGGSSATDSASATASSATHNDDSRWQIAALVGPALRDSSHDPAAALQWWQLPTDGIGLARMEFIINNVIKVHPMALVRFDQLQDQKAREQIAELTRGYEDKSEYFVELLARGIAKIAASPSRVTMFHVKAIRSRQ